MRDSTSTQQLLNVSPLKKGNGHISRFILANNRSSELSSDDQLEEKETDILSTISILNIALSLTNQIIIFLLGCVINEGNTLANWMQRILQSDSTKSFLDYMKWTYRHN